MTPYVDLVAHATHWATDLLQAGGIPDPGTPTAPPGTEGKIESVLGWAKWLSLAVCIAGLMFVGARMAVAGRSSGDGGEHASRLGMVLGGVIVISAAFSLVGFLAT